MGNIRFKRVSSPDEITPLQRAISEAWLAAGRPKDFELDIYHEGWCPVKALNELPDDSPDLKSRDRETAECRCRFELVLPGGH